MMRVLRGLLAAAAIAGAGCGSNDPAPTAGERCKLTASASACVRCQTTKCPTQFDYCFGVGFHRGDLVGADQANRAAPCFGFSTCVQTCGCHDRCFETCNNELVPACGDCQQKYFEPCLIESCAVECNLRVDGGA